MTFYSYKGIVPKVAGDVFIAPGARIIGQVEIGSKSSVWYNCTVRGDVCYIKIGESTNVQDNTVIHVDRNNIPTIIGSGVTIGHSCLLHACQISDNSFVGMGSVIMDGALLEPSSMLAAGSLLTPGKRVKKGEIWAGSPAKFFRSMTEEELAHIPTSALNYQSLAADYITARGIGSTNDY